MVPRENIMPLASRRRFAGTILYTLAAAFFAPAALAQTLPEPVRISRPQLVISGGAEMPIAVQAVSIRAEIHGRYALTEVELTFRNPNNRVLEGELQFPLPEGQTVLGFA